MLALELVAVCAAGAAAGAHLARQISGGALRVTIACAGLVVAAILAVRAFG